MDILSDGIEKTKKRNEQVKIISEMPEEQRLAILRERFGEKITKSDCKIVSPNDPIWLGSNEEICGISTDMRNFYRYCRFYRECLDSEYTQSKIRDFLIESAVLKLKDIEQIEGLKESIESNGNFSDEKKSELKKLLSGTARTLVKKKIFNEIAICVPYNIEELGLSMRPYNCLIRGGIREVDELIAETEESLMGMRMMGKRSYDEIIEKMQSFGIKMVKGQFVREGLEDLDDIDIDPSIEKVKKLEEKIDESRSISEERKEELKKLLRKTFVETSDRETESNIGNTKYSEGKSKDELVKHILEQQSIIAKQRREIDELSSKRENMDYEK